MLQGQGAEVTRHGRSEKIREPGQSAGGAIRYSRSGIAETRINPPVRLSPSCSDFRMRSAFCGSAVRIATSNKPCSIIRAGVDRLGDLLVSRFIGQCSAVLPSLSLSRSTYSAATQVICPAISGDRRWMLKRRRSWQGRGGGERREIGLWEQIYKRLRAKVTRDKDVHSENTVSATEAPTPPAVACQSNSRQLHQPPAGRSCCSCCRSSSMTWRIAVSISRKGSKNNTCKSTTVFGNQSFFPAVSNFGRGLRNLLY